MPWRCSVDFASICRHMGMWNLLFLGLPEGRLREVLYQHIQNSLTHAEKLSDYVKCHSSSKRQKNIKTSITESKLWVIHTNLADRVVLVLSMYFFGSVNSNLGSQWIHRHLEMPKNNCFKSLDLPSHGIRAILTKSQLLEQSIFWCKTVWDLKNGKNRALFVTILFYHGQHLYLWTLDIDHPTCMS